MTDTPFEHYYVIIAFHVRDRILPDRLRGTGSFSLITGQNDVRFISNHDELHAWRFIHDVKRFNRRKIELSVVVV